VVGLVAALTVAEALRDKLRQVRGGRPLRTQPVSYGSSTGSAPDLVGRARFQEAARAQRAIAVDGQFGPESVRALQVLLTRKGLNPGKIDGIFGTKAKRAFQEFLRGCGYVVGKIDGFFGPRSVMALQSWVKEISPTGNSGVTIDGIFGPCTTRALQQALNAELGAKTPPGLREDKGRRMGRRTRSDADMAKSRTSRSGTLSSMGYLSNDAEMESRKPRRSLSERRLMHGVAASAA